MGIVQAKLECFEPFHQHSLKERGKGYAMVIKNIYHLRKAEREYDYTRFQGQDKVDLRYEDTILEVFPSKRPPSPSPLISQLFFIMYIHL